MIYVPITAERPFVLESDEGLDEKYEVKDDQGKVIRTLKDAYADFKKTGDLSKLPVKASAKLAVFRVKPLRPKVYAQVNDLFNAKKPTEACHLAFRAGLQGSDGYVVKNEPAVWKTHLVSGVDLLTDECFDANFHSAVYTSVGAFVWEISNLDP